MSDLYVSVSKLKAYDECPYRAQHEDRPFESSLKQRRGETFHKAVEQYVVRRWSADDGRDFVRRNWPRGEDEADDTAREQFVDAFEWIIDTRWVDLDRYIATEQSFRLKRFLSDGTPYMLGGRVDAVRRSPAELIDWKMTEYLDRDIDQYRAEIATPIYGAYAESVTGASGVKVSYVRPLLRDRSPAVSFWLEHEDIVEGMLRVDELAARYFGADHPRRGNRWCSSCSFVATCPQAQVTTVPENPRGSRPPMSGPLPTVGNASAKAGVLLETAAVQKLARGVAALLSELHGRDYLQELLGYECVDAGVTYGAAGANSGLYFFSNCGVGETWPTTDEIEAFSWEELRAFVEFLAPRVSAGVEKDGYFHQWNDCGWHFETFDHRPAFKYLRTTTNQLFKMCRVPFFMNEIGRIVPAEQVAEDVRALINGYYDAYVSRASRNVATMEAALEAAEGSEWVINPKDSLALLHSRGLPDQFVDDRCGMLPGTLSIQRRAAVIVASDLDPDVIPF